MRNLTPRQIVAELDAHIVGQADAKRAVADRHPQSLAAAAAARRRCAPRSRPRTF